MYLLDAKSAVGTGVTILFATIGGLTLQEWAAIVAIVVGLLTAAYTIYRWTNDVNHNSKKKQSDNENPKS